MMRVRRCCPNLAGHFILGRLTQELDVVDLAVSVKGVHEDAQAPAWRSFLVIQLCEDPIFRLCLQFEQGLLPLWSNRIMLCETARCSKQLKS